MNKNVKKLKVKFVPEIKDEQTVEFYNILKELSDEQQKYIAAIAEGMKISNELLSRKTS